jgi:hypothetical protein
VELPFATISDYTLDLKNNAAILDSVTQKEFCQVYHLGITIDTADSNFFNQILTDYNMYIKFNYSMDIDILNDAKMNMTDDKMNQVITE